MTERNHLLDNTKIITIFLVVFGHLIEPLIQNSTLIKSIYMSIYSVHMPIFVIISGMFAKNVLTNQNVKKIINSSLIPFFAFTIIYELFSFILFKKVSSYTLNIQPYWILWFLYSLFFWKLTLPLILKLKYPLTISITISLVAGYFEDIGYFLGVSRTLYFFPFFIIGYQLKHSAYSLSSFEKIPKVIFFAIIIFNLIWFYFNSTFPSQWLLGSYSYTFFGYEPVHSLLLKLTFYGVSFISSLALLMLFPKNQHKYTAMGKNSLLVYVWHGFFIKFIIGIGFIRLLSEQNDFVSLTLLFIIAITLTTILSMNFISQYTNTLILKPISKLFKTASK